MYQIKYISIFHILGNGNTDFAQHKKDRYSEISLIIAIEYCSIIEVYSDYSFCSKLCCSNRFETY